MHQAQHQKKLSDLRHKRAKDEENNPNEKREMVIQGAVLKCPYCPVEGKLVVTSNTLKLQDQFWATEGDKNNMINLQFPGTCGHPNFAGKPPPPCMSVINLEPWRNMGTNYIQEQLNLVKESYITCNPVPNVAIAQPERNVAGLTAQGSIGGIEVVNAYWCDDTTGKNPTSNLLFKKNNNKAYIFIKFTDTTPYTKYKLKIYDHDLGLGNDDEIYTKDYIVTYKDTVITVDITGAIFDEGMDNDIDKILRRIDLYFKIELDGGREEEYCNEAEKRLKVHLVRYIPKIMELKGWTKGQALQERWFGRNSTDLRKDYADIANIISMDWVLSYKRAKVVYDKMINDKIWINTKGQTALINEINKMKLTLPTEVGAKVDFGDFSITETRNSKGEKAPAIDIYHYQERAFESDSMPSTEDLDDLFAALANFVFRMAARGTIKRETKLTYKITITEVGIYVHDSFDFIDEGIGKVFSQRLGNWSAKEMDVNSNIIFKGSSYYAVDNASYRLYSRDTRKGSDFFVYSDVKTTTVNDSFSAFIFQLISK